MTWASIASWPNSAGIFWFGAAPLSAGKILTCGGQSYNGSDVQEPHCYIYDPVANTWTMTGDLNTLRTIPRMVVLNNGKILAVGGRVVENSGDPMASCELYDPSTGLWTNTGPMNTARNEMGIWKLASGDVLVAGGNSGSESFSQTATTELYSVSDGTWTDTSQALPAGGTGYPFFFSLDDGTPIIAGGYSTGGNRIGTYSYTSGGGWAHVTDLPVAVNSNDLGIIIPLTNGKLMIAGCSSDTAFTPSAAVYIFDPVAMTWSTAGSMNKARQNCFQGALPNGGAFVAGGETNDDSMVTGGETYDAVSNTWTEQDDLVVNKANGTSISNGGVWYYLGGSTRPPLVTLTDMEGWDINPSGIIIATMGLVF